ncbi:MAG: class II glutamine amidotransferase [Capsulimonadaceae bacterium]
MCRMIAAVGNVNTQAVLSAAREMSLGRSAVHEYGGLNPNRKEPLMQHLDGWGFLFREDNELRCIRSTRPIAEDAESYTIAVNTDLAVVHMRNASDRQKLGIEYTHPISRTVDGTPIYFFHNGYAPDVYARLGRSKSEWDTLELLDLVIDGFGLPGWAERVLETMSTLPDSTTSANFMLVSSETLTICNWYPLSSGTPEYYTLYCCSAGGLLLVSSEPILGIAGVDRWTALPNGSLSVVRTDQRSGNAGVPALTLVGDGTLRV